MTLFNAVFQTPCGGKVSSTLRLRDGVPEMNVNANIDGSGPLNPDVPEGVWLPMEQQFGRFASADEMAAAVNARPGWSVVER